MRSYKTQKINMRRRFKSLLINVIRFLEIKGLIKFSMMPIIIFYRLLICKLDKNRMKRQSKFML